MGKISQTDQRNVDFMMSRLLFDIRSKLKQQRILKKLTETETAVRAGLSRTTIAKIEDNPKYYPRLPDIVKICYALDLNPKRLFEDFAGIHALVIFTVSKEPEKLVRLLKNHNVYGVEHAFFDGEKVVTFVHFQDTDELGAFILEYTRSLAHVKKTLTYVIIRKYTSPQVDIDYANEKLLNSVFALYSIEFEKQEELVEKIVSIPYVREVMAITGEKDIFVWLYNHDEIKLKNSVQKIRELGLTELYISPQIHDRA